MRALAIALLLIIASGASWGAQQMTDAQIRERLIQASIASYTGNCPCPYYMRRNGRRCGANSAYSKPGGAVLLCFPKDVPQVMVDAFRAQTGTR
jgi:hypothetical protein